MSNVATMGAFIGFISGGKQAVWEPTRRGSAAG